MKLKLLLMILNPHSMVLIDEQELMTASQAEYNIDDKRQNSYVEYMVQNSDYDVYNTPYYRICTFRYLLRGGQP